MLEYNRIDMADGINANKTKDKRRYNCNYLQLLLLS